MDETTEDSDVADNVDSPHNQHEDGSVERTVNDTFRVTFVCANCGDEFSETYPPRTEVESRTDGRVRVHEGDVDVLGDFDVVRCPTCELLKHVDVADRTPIADENADETMYGVTDD